MLSMRYDNANFGFGRKKSNNGGEIINENPLGLLIVLDKTGRRGSAIDSKNVDGNRSDDNDMSAFSYSSDTDDEDDWNEDRRAYFNELNDEFALASYKQCFHFEPCRKLTRDSGKKNVYKRTKDRDGNKRELSGGMTRKISDPTHFWSPSSSWSAIGRFFGKLKQGHHSTRSDRRRLSLQPAAANGDLRESNGLHRLPNLYDDAPGFFKQLKLDLQNRKQNGDVSHYKVVSRNSDDTDFTVTTKGSERLAICKEYFSRLSCYDAMPQCSQVVAIHVNTPVEEVFHILHGHRALAAVLWASPQLSPLSTWELCDIGHLIRLFWPLFTDASSSRNVEHFKRPVREYCASVKEDKDQNNAIQHGVPAGSNLIEGARLLCEQRGRQFRLTENETETEQHRVVYKNRLLPLVNDITGDVVHILTANDIFRYLCKELCKFDLTSTFDNTFVSDVPRFAFLNSSQRNEKRMLYSHYTLKEACSILIDSELSVLPVFNSWTSKLHGAISLLDVVDVVMKSGNGADEMLSTSLNELADQFSKNDIPAFELNTPLSKVMKTIASSTCDHGNWDCLLPVATIVNSSDEFIGYLEAEDLLTVLLPIKGTEDVRNVTRRTGSYGHDGRDSGVGDDEVGFPEDTLCEV